MEDKQNKEIVGDLNGILEELLREFESKNPLSMLIKILSLSVTISEKLNVFIGDLSLDVEISKGNFHGLKYDLFGTEKFPNSSIDVHFDQVWERKYIEKGILSQYPKLFSMDEKERKHVVFEYYKEHEQGLGFANCIYGDDGLELKVGIPINQDTLRKHCIEIIEHNYSIGTQKEDQDKKKYFYALNALVPIEIVKGQDIKKEKGQVHKFLSQELDILMNHQGVMKIVEEYIAFKNSKEREGYNKKFYNKLQEVEGKRVILNFYRLKDFVVFVYGNAIMSLFSNLIVRKLTLKTETRLLKTSEYKILKYMTYSIAPKNEIEAFYVKRFFQDFEARKMMVKYLESKMFSNTVFLVFTTTIIFLLFGNYLFLNNAYFETIVVILVGLLFVFLMIQVTRFKHIILSGMCASIVGLVYFGSDIVDLKGAIYDSLSNHTSFTGNTQLCLSGSNLEVGKDMLLSIAIAKLLEDYEKKTEVPLSQDLKDTYTQKIKEEYLQQDLLLSNTIDLKLLNTAYKRILAP